MYLIIGVTAGNSQFQSFDIDQELKLKDSS